jgi:hypothetical protein
VSELAYNKNGEPFEVHDDAAYWRARRCRDRGLEVVYRRGRCTPLTLPIGATEAEFAHAVGFAPGKYRLDQLSEALQPIVDAQPAYVYVHAANGAGNDNVDACEEANADGDVDARADELPRNVTPLRPASLSSTEYLLHMTVEANTRMAEHVIRRFSGMIDSGAHVIRAADGAGMPARPPVVELRNAESMTDEEPDEPETADHATWPDVIQSCIPYVNMAFSAIFGPKLRNAKPASSEPRPRRAANVGARTAANDPPATEATETVEETPIEITPAMKAHFMSIYGLLTPDEGALARDVVSEMTEAELATWMQELMALSVEGAAAKVKAKLAELRPSEEDAS